MSLPRPVPGLVLRYSYFWHSEFLTGREEGRKDRPCAIVAAIRTNGTGETRVLVLPVTHSPPEQSELAIEIPAAVKRRLRLDDARSWIVLSEWNEFVWPGPDLRPLPGDRDRAVADGMLPPALFETVRQQFLRLVRSSTPRPVQRT